MADALTALQLALACVLLFVIAERLRYLFYLAPLSADGLKFVVRAIEQGGAERAAVWAERAPDTHVGQLLRAARGDADDSLSEALFDLQARAIARLRLLRVGATVASTFGLLVGIVRIRGGFGEPAGLLALEAGLPEKMALSAALFSMAVGVGTSAVCFYALATLRTAARGLITQGTRVAGALERKPHGSG